MKRAIVASFFILSTIWTAAPNLSVRAETGFACEQAGRAVPPSLSVPDATSQQPVLCPNGDVPVPTGHDVPKVQPLLHRMTGMHAMTATDACAPVAGTGANYCWATAYQYPSSATQGASADYTQEDPAIAAGDAGGHSLAEMWAGTTDLKEAIEVGWGVFPGVFGGTLPHLWVYHWVDGAPQGYDTNFTPYVQSPAVGMVVTPGATVNYEVQYYQGNWWVGYGGTWFGYFAGSLWAHAAEPFTSIGEVSWYGEVESALTQPATAMGNGIMGTQAGAATISNIHLVGSSVALGWIPPTSTKYSMGQQTASGFSYGGPGYVAATRPVMRCFAIALINGVPTPVCPVGGAGPVSPPIPIFDGTALLIGSPPYRRIRDA